MTRTLLALKQLRRCELCPVAPATANRWTRTLDPNTLVAPAQGAPCFRSSRSILAMRIIEKKLTRAPFKGRLIGAFDVLPELIIIVTRSSNGSRGSPALAWLLFGFWALGVVVTSHTPFQASRVRCISSLQPSQLALAQPLSFALFFLSRSLGTMVAGLVQFAHSIPSRPSPSLAASRSPSPRAQKLLATPRYPVSILHPRPLVAACPSTKKP